MSRIILTAASRIGCVRSNNEDMVFKFASDIELKNLMKGTL